MSSTPWSGMGVENLDAIEATVARTGSTAISNAPGWSTWRRQPWQYKELVEVADAMRAHGYRVDVLDADAMRARGRVTLVSRRPLDPRSHRDRQPGEARLGIAPRMHRRRRANPRQHRGAATRCRHASGSGSTTAHGSGHRRAASRSPPMPTDRCSHGCGRSSFPCTTTCSSPNRSARQQLTSIGWAHRQGIGDSGNQFHYYRLTADSRILWGGYDAIYHFGNRVDVELEQRAADLRQARRAFLRDVPAARRSALHASMGRRDRHVQPLLRILGNQPWRSGRVCARVHGARRGRVTVRRPGDARPAREPADRADARCAWSARVPLPFPPEPLRYGVVQLTRWSLDRADRNEGARNLWLKALDLAGLGFDS